MQHSSHTDQRKKDEEFLLHTRVSIMGNTGSEGEAHSRTSHRDQRRAQTMEHKMLTVSRKNGFTFNCLFNNYDIGEYLLV